MLFISTRHNLQNFGVIPFIKPLKQQLNSEKQWKMRWKANPLICFCLSYVVFLSNAWKNVGMTMMCNRCDVMSIITYINIWHKKSNGIEQWQRKKKDSERERGQRQRDRKRAELWNIDSRRGKGVCVWGGGGGGGPTFKKEGFPFQTSQGMNGKTRMPRGEKH